MHVSFLIGLLCINGVYCANILAIFAVPCRSHFRLGTRLMEGLLAKGHLITMISPYKLDKEIANYTEIVLGNLESKITEKKSNFFNLASSNIWQLLTESHNLGYFVTKHTLHQQSIKDLAQSNKTYDAVIISHFLNEALAVIPYLLKAPTIYLSTLSTSTWINHFVANPAPLSYVSNLALNRLGQMGFKKRLLNTIAWGLEELYRWTIMYPKHDKLLQDIFPGVPSLSSLIFNQNPFILVNSHVSTNDPMPHLPNMVEIGGFHLKETVLPEEMKTFLDAHSEGVVYFSLGSNLQSALLPDRIKNDILNTFRKFKVQFLWKFEDDGVPALPENVHISKWYPQQAILAHPNVKLFISHGGLLSITESVYHGVPLVGIPIYGDQAINMQLATTNGYAQTVLYPELNEETLTKALREVLYNSSYRENAQQRSVIMKDRLVPPLDEAVYWVEYVIKHKGVKHFRHSGMDLKWYELEMLDVAMFLLVVVTMSIAIMVFLSGKLYGTRRTTVLNKLKKY